MITKSRLTFYGIQTRTGFFIMHLANLVGVAIVQKDTLWDWCAIILMVIVCTIISLILVMITRNISIENDRITYTNWLTGKSRIYDFKDLDGYSTIVRPIGFLYAEHQSVLLVKGNKRIGEISHYYYSNYDELKDGLKGLKYFGQEDNNDFKSIKNHFNELLSKP